mgnify:CR=1 FL=1
MGVRRDIEILGLALKQNIANSTADEIALKPCAVQTIEYLQSSI